jgi:hypothetical protein
MPCFAAAKSTCNRFATAAWSMSARKDLVGSEFAGRHLQYEKFYAGAPFIVRNHSYRETDWAAFGKIVDDLMAGYDYPAAASPGEAAAE